MESEGCRSSSSTSEELPSFARLAADFNDDDDGYINDFIEKAYAARPPPPSSSSPWRPSRFEGSTNTVSCYLKTKLICGTPSPHLPMANIFSPGGASLSDRLPPPGVAQVNASMPRLLDLPCNTGMEIPMESVTLDYSLDFQTDMTPIGASVDALHPHHIRGLRHELMEPLSKSLSPPATQLSSATEFATELCASTPPVYADLPHPPRLASQQSMSMTPSPGPPPARFGRVGASVSRRSRAAAPIVFDQPAMSAPPSLTGSGYIGSLLQSTNEPMGFGSSAPGLFGASLARQERIATLTSAVGKLTHIKPAFCSLSYV